MTTALGSSSLTPVAAGLAPAGRPLVPLLVESLELHSRVRPEAVAVRDDSGAVTYAELHARVSRLADAIETADLPARVAVRAGNDVAHLAALLALPATGRTGVVMDPRWTVNELVAAREAFGATVMLTDQPDAEALEGSGFEVHDLGAAAGSGDGPSDRVLRTVAGPDGTFLVTPGGGTSGRIKGSRITHAAQISRIVTQLVEFGIPAGGTFLASTPLFHGSARSLGLGYLYCGGTVHLMQKFDVQRWLRAAEDATATFCVPTMLRRLVEAAEHPLDPRLRLLTGGAPIEQELVERVRRRLTPRFFDYYASVESGPITVRHPNEHDLPAGCVGRPAFSVQVEIRDPDDQGIGRVVVGGPGISTGVEGAAEPIAEGAEIEMGDLGRFDAAGRLHLHGRADDVIISGGVNVEPSEVEAVLEVHPDVRAAAVVGVPDAEWGRRVVAAVVTASGRALPEGELDGYLRSRLAPAKRPKEVRYVTELPLTGVGKVDRRAVVEVFTGRAR
ncbi:MAG TPA: class I adenylate-forming enzyme family protein [Cellulomonas sp.]